LRKFQADKIFQPRGVVLDRPIDLGQTNVFEIGPGVGKHPIQYAIANPSHRMLAVEHSSERFEKFRKRVEAHRIKGEALMNLDFFQCDAESFAVHFLPERSIDKIFLLYPNPYPKASQSNKRWHNMPFMEFLLTRLKDGGELELATNEKFYADEARKVLAGTPTLKLVKDENLTKQKQDHYVGRTHFEKKYLERGEAIFQLVWRYI